MLYRKISIYRAMRLFAEGRVKNLFFQRQNKELHRVTDYNWDSKDISKKAFFELEELV